MQVDEQKILANLWNTLVPSLYGATKSGYPCEQSNRLVIVIVNALLHTAWLKTESQNGYAQHQIQTQIKQIVRKMGRFIRQNTMSW